MHDNFYLDAIGIVEGTNKNLLEVDYLRHYAEFFSPYRDKEIVVIEIGVAHGGSLRTWERYFPRATIVGIDIHQTCKRFEQGRIKIEIGSQADIEFLGKLCEKYPPTIVIDDGSHRADYTMTSFEYLFPKLEPGGCYVIEDLYVHFGAAAAQWRGDADKTPIEFLQNLTASLLGSILFPTAKKRNKLLLENQIDRLCIIGGAAFIWKKRSEHESNALLRRAEEVVRGSRHPQSWYYLAIYTLKNDGSLDSAEDAIRKAIELNPKDAVYYKTLAEVVRRKNDVPGAMAILTEALKVPGLYGGSIIEDTLDRWKNLK